MSPRLFAALAASLLVLVALPASSDPLADFGSDGRLVVAPLNLGVPIEPEIAPALEPVWQELLQQLAARSEAPGALNAAEARILWNTAMEGAETGDPYTAYARFARQVGEYLDFGAIVVPAVIVRTAKVRGTVARWDGTQQRFDARGDLGMDPVLQMSGFDGARAKPREMGAASLLVLVLDPEGNVLFEKKSGLSLIHEVVRHRDGVGLAVRSDAFDDPNDVRLAVARAFEAPSPASPAH